MRARDKNRAITTRLYSNCNHPETAWTGKCGSFWRWKTIMELRSITHPYEKNLATPLLRGNI